MPKRKEPEPTRDEQFAEFVKTAREFGVDENAEVLERMFKKLAPKKRAQKTKGPFDRQDRRQRWHASDVKGLANWVWSRPR